MTVTPINRNAQGCILVYDISNRESFLSMEHWFGECARYAEPGVVKYLVSPPTTPPTHPPNEVADLRRGLSRWGVSLTKRAQGL